MQVSNPLGMLSLPALVLVAWLRQCADAEVLVVQVPGKEKRQITAVQASWNEALQDATSLPFAGEIYAELDNLDGCKPLQETGARDRLVLLRISEPCSSGPGTLVMRVHAAAEQGAAGVIFFKDKLEGLSHIHHRAPQIRTVMIDSRGGKEILAEFLLAQVSQQPQVGIYAELSLGLALADDAYQDIFIFRLDEAKATRDTSFIWQERPGVLHSRGAKKPLSEEVMELIKDSLPPDHWFTATPSVVPLFNPSILALDDVGADSEEGEITSSFLVTLRMSNGPGCPGLKETSSVTRIFHNELLLLLVDASTFQVIDHCLVETPPVLSAFFGSAGGDSSGENAGESSSNDGDDQSSNDTKRASRGRQFLDEVHGPMDARLHKGADGEIWVSFYAESNGAEDKLYRGMHLAPLHVQLRPCEEDAGSSSSHEDVEMETGAFFWRPVEGIVLGAACNVIGWGEATSLDACKQSCGSHCDGITASDGICALLECYGELDADLSSLAEFPEVWHSWRKQRGFAMPTWNSINASMLQNCKEIGAVVSTPDDDSSGAFNCRENCELSPGCNAACFHADAGLCWLQTCGGQTEEDELSELQPAKALEVPGWECWRHRLQIKEGPEQWRKKGKHQCLQRAWIDGAELIGFDSESGIEKNWGIFNTHQTGFMVEYLLEPHIVLDAHLQRGAGQFQLLAVSSPPSMTRWPQEVLYGVSNIRGGYCCLEFPARLWQRLGWGEKLGAHLQAHGIPVPSGPLLLGCAHLQRIRTPADHFGGDLDRYRRQAKTRTYHHIFYLLRATEPFDVVAVSTEWCISLGGRFSRAWKNIFDETGEIACEALQFVAGLSLRRVRTSSARSSTTSNGAAEAKEEDLDLVLTYGMNDCEADVLTLPLPELLSILRPVHSTWNVTDHDEEL